MATSKVKREAVENPNDPNTFIKYLKDMEGREPDQYPSPEGGADTIGYGHKLKAGESFGTLSDKQMDDLLNRDVMSHALDAQAKVDGKYGKGTFNKLEPRKQFAIVDYEFNVQRDKKGNKGIAAFPNMLDAIIKGDMKKARKESHRSYTDDKKVRRPVKNRNKGILQFLGDK